MKNRIYTVVTPELEEALSQVPEELQIEGKQTEANTLRAWAIFGYRRWLEDSARRAKIEAYREIGEDEEHLATVRESNRRAVRAGIL